MAGVLFVALLPALGGLRAQAQTSIVVIKTQSEIVIGADSKVLRVEDRSRPGSTCKINQVDKVYFASAGIWKELITKFSIRSVATRALQGEGTIADKVKRFEGLVLAPLTEVLNRERRYEPRFYRRYLEGKKVVQIVFFGFEDGSPVVLLREFKAISRARGGVLLEIERTDRRGAEDFNAFLGASDAIAMYKQKPPDSWGMSLADAVRKLVQMEIVDEPESVGPPIDILRLDKFGPQWVQRKQQCPDFR